MRERGQTGRPGERGGDDLQPSIMGLVSRRGRHLCLLTLQPERWKTDGPRAFNRLEEAKTKDSFTYEGGDVKAFNS